MKETNNSDKETYSIPIYGAGWRNWGGKSDDKLYEDYLKKVKDK